MVWSTALLDEQHLTTNVASYATASVSPSGDRLLLLGVVNRSTTPADNPVIPTVTGLSLTWTQIVTHIEIGLAADERATAFWAVTGASPGSGAVTADMGGTNQTGCHLMLLQVDGADLASPLGGTPNTGVNNGGGTSTSLTITLTSAPTSTSRCFAVIEHAANELTAPGTNMTELADGSFTLPNSGACSIWRSDAATQSLDVSWTTGANCVGVGYEVKEAVVAATRVPRSSSYPQLVAH